MKNIIKLSIFSFFLDLFAIVGYITFARNSADTGKLIIVVSFILLNIVLLIIAIKSLNFKDLILLALSFSMILTFVYGMLGFLLFGGLVKDTILFSVDCLKATGKMIIFTFFCYTAGVLLLLFVKNVLKT
jgi:hypothetical protein